MSDKLELNEDRLFPIESSARTTCRTLYESVKDLPIISPHGHTDPSWFAINAPFSNPTELLLKPDHYVLRMLYSQGLSMEELGIQPRQGSCEQDPRVIWKRFAKHYHVFNGTPSKMWLDFVFVKAFNIDVKLSENTAEHYYEVIDSALKTSAFLPRNLFDNYKIELLSTTESPLDNLLHHQTILESDWNGRVISAFRPDPIVDPEYRGFSRNLDTLAALTNEDCESFKSYLSAISIRRAYFKRLGVTSTDHGHPTANTADLAEFECEQLFRKVRQDQFSAAEAEMFRAQMLTEMAKMSLDDGLVMQIHPGSFRNHNTALFDRFGPDKGADIPMSTEYVKGLRPLLNKFGNRTDLTVILFTLDETVYSRELAPLAGHYPILKLGPPWWFHDSPEGMLRFRQNMTETAGFYNTVGFNDDTRAFLSIPARHDVARRMDCHFLANLVAQHRIDMSDALDIAKALSYDLVKQAYKL